MVRRVVSIVESRTVFIAGLTGLALFAAPFTRAVYNPTAVEIHGDQVTVYRTFPGDAFGLPRPSISYAETITPLTQAHNGGHPCVERGGPFQYSRADPVGRWSIEWAADCLSDPQGYRWSARWYWNVGILKFGPAELDHVVIYEKTK